MTGSHRRRAVVARAAWVLAALITSACASAPSPAPTPLAVTPHTLYPLAEDNAWSYDVDTGDESVLAVSRVESVRDASVSVRSGDEVQRYELRADGIYRPARRGYLLRGPIAPEAQWDAGGGTQARIAAVELEVETPAGRFSRCVRVEEQAPSGARIATTYCPGVGPVLVISELKLSRGTARVAARLRGYHVSE